MAMPFSELLSHLGAQHQAVLQERDKLAAEKEQLCAELAVTQASLTGARAELADAEIAEHPPTGQLRGHEACAAPPALQLKLLQPEASHSAMFFRASESMSVVHRQTSSMNQRRTSAEARQRESVMAHSRTWRTSRRSDDHHNQQTVDLRSSWKGIVYLSAEDTGVFAQAEELREGLQKELVAAMTTEGGLVSKNPSRAPSAVGLRLEAITDNTICNWLSKRSLLHPESWVKLFWDICSIVIIAWDIISTPLEFLSARDVVFGTPELLVNIFWTIDILASFRTGFFKRGKLVMNPRKIEGHYMRSWLMFDLLVVLPEWVAFAFQDAEHFSNSSLLKLFRVMRFFRLLRMMKLRKIKHEVMSRIHSVQWLFAIRMVAWLCLTISIMHVFACTWYGIGSEAAGWVEKFQVAQEPLLDRYTIALQWAFSNIQGFAQVYPVTLGERIFALIVSPICVGLFVLLISATTNMMQCSSYFKLEHHQRSARAFLARHKLTPGTAVRLQKVVEDESQWLDEREQDADVMKLLPKELLREIMVQVRGSIIAHRNHIFIYGERRFFPFFAHMCHEVLESEHCREGEVLFHPGSLCKAARCVATGRLHYTIPSMDCDAPLWVAKAQWVCEVALWTVWKNVGTLTAARETTILLVPVDKFSKAASEYVEVHYTFALYAQQYLLYMNSLILPDELVMNPPEWVWEDEHFDTTAVIRDLGMVSLPWAEELPPHLEQQVCEAAVLVAQRIATNGLDESRPHHGFTIVVGDEKALESCGQSGFNPFFGHDKRLLGASGALDEEVFDTLRRNAFNADGAIVVNGATSRVVASGWFVSDLSQGGMSGGARSRSARAVAQEAGGCYVIKCSEDSRGEVILHLMTDRMAFDSMLQSDPPRPLPGCRPHSSRADVLEEDGQSEVFRVGV